MSKSNFVVRAATINDLEIIHDFTLKLHKHEDDKTIPTHTEFSTNLKRWLTNELTNPQSLFLVAEIASDSPNEGESNNSEIAGFIGATSVINDNGFLENPIKGVINLLWVETKYRKRFIANQLLANIEECFKNIAITYVECTYTNTNRLAKSFWEEQGYQCHSVTARKLI